MMTGMMMKISITYNEVMNLEFHTFRKIYNSIIEILKGSDK